MKKENIFIFDVESTSLYGTGFAVGAVVYNLGGTEVDRFEMLSVQGAWDANPWVKENVIPHLKDMPEVMYNITLRQKFYQFYLKHKDTADIWSDCNFPVETNFLAEIVKDSPTDREFAMPYPLKDISTIVDINIDRAKECGIPGLRKHNPLDDARASAYFLLKELNK
jgi:hypothetical protein